MRVKILVLAVLFLALSVLRVFFPESVEYAKQRLAPVAVYGEELIEGFLSLGRRLSGSEQEGLSAETLVSEASQSPETPPASPSPRPLPPEGFNFEQMVTDNLSGTKLPAGLFLPPENEDPAVILAEALPEESPSPEIAETPDPEQEALAVLQQRLDEFLARQAEITELALPESICTYPVLLGFDYASPIAAGLSSGFGYRLHPLLEDMRFHYGSDFEAYAGDVIASFAAGTVSAVEEIEGYGQTVKIDHGGGFSSFYAHCSRIDVEEGQQVALGEQIGLVGSTGNVTGPHLHLELTYWGLYLNPEFYLS
jgi:murein DD-endopeptidase MepM/ murein hydrolase activator NlpD